MNRPRPAGTAHILHHCDGEDIVAISDGMLADDAGSLDLTPVIAHPSGD